MVTQDQVNTICQMINRDGDEITIAGVRNLLSMPCSYVELADKVLLYKSNPSQAIEIAKKEHIDGSSLKKPKALMGLIDEHVSRHLPEEHQHLALNLSAAIMHYVEDEIESKIQDLTTELKKTRLLNDHLEVKYYGIKGRFDELNQQFRRLEEAYYQLSQKYQNLENGKKNYQHDQTDELPAPKFRDYQTQLSLLEGECLAVFDPEKKQIVIRVPATHSLTRELHKGLRSIHLKANAVYDFTTRLWMLDDFELKTVNLLIRNKFVISKELSLIKSYLENKTV
ncbi:MAG: hypothetical protein ACO2ZM_05825 [Francisellaceae bacterium]